MMRPIQLSYLFAKATAKTFFKDAPGAWFPPAVLGGRARPFKPWEQEDI
jgi:hypothetical protein